MKYILLLAVVAFIVWGGSTQFDLLQKSSVQSDGAPQGINIGESLELAQDAKLMLEGGVDLASQVLNKDVQEGLDANLKDTMTNQQLKGDDDGAMVDTAGNGELASAAAGAQSATMLVAGGCFWCVEADIEKLSGVIEVVSGYAEGKTENPTYENYSKNGHREVAEVTYNPSVVTFEEILIYAMKHMDPTDGTGSFYDRGENYAPAFYYETAEQKATINAFISEVNEKGPYDKPLAIAIVERPKFWPAEDYHQNYYKGSLSKLKYLYYRNASGRDELIKKYWGTDTGSSLSWRTQAETGALAPVSATAGFWKSYTKPAKDLLKNNMDSSAFKVTQEDGTERAFSHPYDKFWEEGIYVDVLSGEPLYSSKDKYDSGTGWPSFVKPITSEAVTEHADNTIFSTRTEIRSAIADNHLGHVFSDGPKEKGDLRYCMNGVALTFVAKADMEAEGYGDFLYLFEM